MPKEKNIDEEHRRILGIGVQAMKNLTEDERKGVTQFILDGLMICLAKGDEKYDALVKLMKLVMCEDPGCYFCNKDIDGNEVEFTKDTHLCLFCTVKVANILHAFGINPRRIFPDIAYRDVQKTFL